VALSSNRKGMHTVDQFLVHWSCLMEEEKVWNKLRTEYMCASKKCLFAVNRSILNLLHTNPMLQSLLPLPKSSRLFYGLYGYLWVGSWGPWRWRLGRCSRPRGRWSRGWFRSSCRSGPESSTEIRKTDPENGGKTDFIGGLHQCWNNSGFTHKCKAFLFTDKRSSLFVRRIGK